MSKFGTSYQGELVGIKLALENALLLTDNHPFNELHIFCDCQSAIQTVATVGHDRANHRSTVTLCKQLIKNLNDKQIATKITWVCGHAGLTPNELADGEAKAAAESANLDIIPAELHAAQAKNIIKQHQLDKWQHAWDTGTTGRTAHNIFPKVKPKTRTRRPSRLSDTKLNRLRSGFSKLKDHLYQHGRLVESPQCECGQHTEDTRHYLLECELFAEQREEMINSIETTYKRHDTPPPNRTIDVTTLLGGNQDLSPEVAQDIQSAVCFFIKATRRSV